jgi:predicted small metal-binding protein
MYSVACTDLGFDCSFVAQDRSPRKVRDLMLDHARDAHPEVLAGITDVERRELVRRIDDHVVEEAA